MGKLGEVSAALSNLPRYSNGVGIDFFLLINDLCSETIQSASQRWWTISPEDAGFRVTSILEGKLQQMKRSTDASPPSQIWLILDTLSKITIPAVHMSQRQATNSVTLALLSGAESQVNSSENLQHPLSWLSSVKEELYKMALKWQRRIYSSWLELVGSLTLICCKKGGRDFKPKKGSPGGPLGGSWLMCVEDFRLLIGI